MTEYVILVDENDRQIGTAEKLAAHQNGGQLHRAFSIFVYNAAGELLLQQRARVKYHFGGLWSNTCCGHPRPGETVTDAAERRLAEEFGFNRPLSVQRTLIYDAHDSASGLTEREFLHILTGRFDGLPRPNPEEIDAFGWKSPTAVAEELRNTSQRFTPWFPLAFLELHDERGAPAF